MDTVPRDVIECVILDGQMPQYGDGAEWCEQHDSCSRCAKDIHDMMVEEIRRLKAERDRALAELDKALGEREDAMLSERNAAYNAGYDEGFASADDWLAQHEDAMEEHGWVRGPLDADGKMWRSGDMSDSNWGVIEGIAYEDGRWLVSGHDTSAPWVPADSIRHYHAPTVEDVLQEFADQYAFYKQVEKGIHPDLESHKEVLRQFAAKLRLADE